MRTTLALVGLMLVVFTACTSGDNEKAGAVQHLRGASSYTPYDAFAMLWSQGAEHDMVWVSSGAEAGRLLVSEASSGRRPDWALCTQGVVAGLASQGRDVRIIATVYVSDATILPVFRSPRGPLSGGRSLFIPRSSIEFAFDRLLRREGLSPDDVSVPVVEKVGFTTIIALLAKPQENPDAIDFALLVDPFITNLMSENPGMYEIGSGGLYDMHYCLVARTEDLLARRSDYLRLLSQMLEVDKRLQTIASDDEFREQVWGRSRDGEPERLPALLTFARNPLRLGLDVGELRSRLREEILYLTEKYPGDLIVPENLDGFVDPSLLAEIDPNRVRD